MGSGVSKTPVQVIHIDGELEKSAGWTEAPLVECDDERRDIEELREQLKEAENRARIAESQLLINRDAPIDDQVALLERELALLRGERAEENGVEIVKKLESDLRTAAEEMTAMRARYEKKVKRVRSASARSRAENQLEMIALKDENERLVDENVKLKSQLQKSSSPADSGRSRLVIELSQQVTALNDELTRARHTIGKLKQKDTPTNVVPPSVFIDKKSIRLSKDSLLES